MLSEFIMIIDEIFCKIESIAFIIRPRYLDYQKKKKLYCVSIGNFNSIFVYIIYVIKRKLLVGVTNRFSDSVICGIPA